MSVVCFLECVSFCGFFLVFPDRYLMKKKTLSEEQRALLLHILNEENSLSEKEIVTLASGVLNPLLLSETQLLQFLQVANGLYRAGCPIISDAQYDSIFIAELRRRQLDHPFLHNVEPEPVVGVKTVELPSRMLSTEKAYDFQTIVRWGNRIEKTAETMGKEFSSLLFRGTPKLDGFAAYDDGLTLYTRGDGRRGTDITRAFDRGLQVASGADRGLGAGEIVVDKNYFSLHLADIFDNSRNFQASLIKEKELTEPVVLAIESGAAVFFPFSVLPDWTGSWSELSESFDTIVESLWDRVPYEIDGVVFEVIDSGLQLEMGATRHHHRWQIAFKKNTQTAKVRIIKVSPQTSRSGRINPVAEVEPTRLSGALIQRVTAHHYGMVRDNGIGAGALVEMSRSVFPFSTFRSECCQLLTV